MGILGRRRSTAGAPGRGDLREMFEEWTPDELFELHRRRVERYLPIWFAVHGPLAEAAGTPEPKRELHRQRMSELLDRCDAVRAGEKVVKARLNETESAISAVTNHARHEPTRRAALTARRHLQLAADPSGAQYPAVLTGEVYAWAEIETGFPGDSAALLQALPRDQRTPPPGGDRMDGYHLLYDGPARRAGLGKEGQAVFRAVVDIVATLTEDLEPFPVGDVATWLQGSGPAAEQRAAAYEDFHGRPPPPWLR